MRRILPAFLAVASIGLSAQDVATSPRFAFFSIGQLVEKSVKARKVFTELEVTKKNLEDKLKAKGEEFQRLQQQLQSGSLSDEGREKVQKQLRDLEFEGKKMQEDSQAELQKLQSRVFGALDQMARPYIDQLAKEQKLQVVFVVEQSQQMIAWADVNWVTAFTGEVAKRLDAAEAAPAASKPAAPAASKPTAPVKK